MKPDVYDLQPVRNPERARQLDYESRLRQSRPTCTVIGGSKRNTDVDWWVGEALANLPFDLIGGAFGAAGDVCWSIGEGAGDIIGGALDGW